MDCSPPGSSIYGISQARILEWPFPSPGDLSNPGIEPTSLALQADSLPLSHKDHNPVMQRGLCNSVKLWVMPGRARQDGRVIMKTSDKTWSTGEGNGNPTPVFLFGESHRQHERAKRSDTRRWGSPGRKVSNMLHWGKAKSNHLASKNEAPGTKQEWRLAVDVPGGEVKSNAIKNNVA